MRPFIIEARVHRLPDAQIMSELFHELISIHGPFVIPDARLHSLQRELRSQLEKGFPHLAGCFGVQKPQDVCSRTANSGVIFNA